MGTMKKAGIREARQNLSALIEEVRRGREVVITDRGEPVARLVPAARPEGSGFHGRARFRRSMPRLRPSLSSAIAMERDDRI